MFGAGAVGSYYGALLARDGHSVRLLARGEHREALHRRGEVTVREPDGSEWRAPVVAPARPAGPHPDLLVITTKSHHTAAAAASAAALVGPETLVLSLQNGVENAAAVDAALSQPRRTLAGIAFVGVSLSAPGVVDHEAEGWVRVGDPAGGLTDRTQALMRVVGASWDVSASADIELEQWRKLLWNVGFNAICALTGASAGQALARADSAALVRAAMEEVLALARSRRIALSQTDIEEMARDNRELRHYRPSTARDLDAGRPTERAALCGFVAREGARADLDCTVNRVLDGLLALREDLLSLGFRRARNL